MPISDNAVIAALFLIAPQFQTVDPVILANYIALLQLVKCQINYQILACCGVLAAALLLAHYLTLSVTPTLGVASNLHEGQLSIGFNVSPDISALLLTPYGRSYVDLVKRTLVGSFVTNLPLPLGGVITNAPTRCGCSGLGFWPFAGA